MSMNDIADTYNRLIKELQAERYAETIIRTSTDIELVDGRRAWIIMEITTIDPEGEI